jgi:predicted aspartyl protease
MTGVVDESGRAMLSVRMRVTASGPVSDLDVWIDTGFTGDLVLPAARIAALGLLKGITVEPILADGSLTQLDTYACLIEWFGEWKSVEVVANQGRFPLLGVGLLLDHDLHIDYRTKTVIVG